MDYKIKYHDALEGIRELYNSDCDMIRVKRLRRRLEHIFPELAESEDEKIREALKQGFFEYGNSFTTFGGIQVGDILAWLEKQGKRNPVEWSEEDEKIKESIKKVLANTNFNKLDIKYSFYEMISWLDKQREQAKFEPNPTWSEEDEEMLKWLCRIIHSQRLDKAITLKEESELGEWIDKWLNYNPQTKQSEQPTNKIKSRFKEGDWITDGRITCKVLGVTGKSYELHLHNDDYCHFETDIQSVDKYYRLWTVQDAKDGDVLINGSNIFIFHFINDTRLMGYCHVNIDNGRFYDDIGKNECFCLIDAIVTPTTKEQRDMLFHKMKEEGYEWNSEKKELKKVEQKPDDNVEPKFKPGDWIIFNGLILHIDEVVNGYYRTTSRGDGIHNSYDWNIDNAARLWTIQEAKDGDVLVCEDENFTIPFIAIYKCLGDTIYNNKGLKDLTFNSHCFMGFNGNFYEGEGGHIIEGIHPATKEQRDMLFRKMKEAGYEWDAQKKEVKKPTDKVEPRFKEGDFIMNNDITEDGKPEIFKIIKVCSSWYDVENVYDGRQTMITFSQDYTCHLWTINDAKQGDILMVDNEFIVVLYRKMTDGTEWKDTSILTEYQYDINDNTFTKGSHLFYCDICPATYTQREILTNYIQQELKWEK